MLRTLVRGGLGLIGLVFLTFLACSPEAAVGSVQLVGSLSQSVSASAVTQLRVTVTAPDMSPYTASFPMSGSAWSGTLAQLPAGTQRTFKAEALDAQGTVLYAGEAPDVTVLAGKTTVVSIVLQQVAPPPPFENSIPVITSLTVSPGTVEPGGSVALKASAQDANAEDTLTYAWTASAGSFSSTTSLSTTWTAPAVTGPVTVTFTVTDSRGAASSTSFTVQVSTSAGGANVDVHLNTWPQVSRVTASPSSVLVGETATVTATAADSDGDALSYQWTASCAGTWASATSATGQFTPTEKPSGDTCPNCQLTVTVKDGRGGQATGTLSICAGSKPSVQYPPEITDAYRSAASVGAGGSVTLGVKASDPQGSAMTFAWQANVGTLSTPASTATGSEVVWTSPSCIPEGVSPTITATVTNAFNLSTKTTFSITGVTCAPAAVCGDGMLGGSEACDDGNTVTETACPYGTPTCTACDATCTTVLALTGPSCGDGIVNGSEVCDDGNNVTETSCPTGTTDCTVCNATCTEVLHLTRSICGDGVVSPGEACDDGNTVTETSCPYGMATCTRCNATCATTLNLTGPYCGDGVLNSGFETCDDANTNACGTCSANCQQLQLASATGLITAVAGSSMVDGSTFAVSDGTTTVTFEFDKNGSYSSSRTPVSFTTALTADQIATAIAAAINGTPFAVRAVASASTVSLTNTVAGSMGNRGISTTGMPAGFKVSGMAGGAGWDCSQGFGCTRNEDCDHSLQCRSDGTCGIP